MILTWRRNSKWIYNDCTIQDIPQQWRSNHHQSTTSYHALTPPINALADDVRLCFHAPLMRRIAVWIALFEAAADHTLRGMTTQLLARQHLCCHSTLTTAVMVPLPLSRRHQLTMCSIYKHVYNRP